MIKRLLLALLLAWIAIVPAVASSCAVGCETDSAQMPSVTFGHEVADASTSPDCHGDADTHGDSELPDGNSMAIACFVAGAVSLPPLTISLVKILLTSEQDSFVLLPPLSFQTSAPNKPPQA